MIVGFEATADGSLFIARNDDTGDAHSSVNNLVYHPARSEPAVFRSNANKLVMELPAPSLAYTAMPTTLADAATGRNASGESAGVNAAAVAMSATETIFNSAAALAADPYNRETGLTEDALPSLLLPQATSARQAMALLGSWVESIGASEGFGVMLADAREAWYVETASGHHWLAQRVPDDSIFVSANQGRFQEVNLSDTGSVMHSPGLLEFAVASGLYDPTFGRPFNFLKAFMSDGASDERYNHPRVCSLQYRLAGVRSPCTDASQPTFVRPAPQPHFLLPGRRLLGLHDVMSGLRDHFDGSPHDAYLHSNPDDFYRPVAVLRTSAAHVTRLRPTSATLPSDLAVINYVAMGMPLLSPFIPIYAGLPGDALPPELTIATTQPDALSLYWKARRLQALVFQDLVALMPGAVAAIQAWEADVEARQRPAFERRYLAAGAAARRDGGVGGDAARAVAGFTSSVVAQACDLLERLTQRAAEALGLPPVPPDEQLVQLLDEAATRYSFRPTAAGLLATE